MKRVGFYFNSAQCKGCKTCQVACKKRNGLPIGINYRQVHTFEVGAYPDASWYHVSVTCNHCKNPACVRACPTGAMYKSDEDGTVQHDDGVCIGCQQCVNSCPYGVPRYFPELKIVGKCYACKDTREADGAPTCVASCPQRALEFGPFEELAAAHPDAIADIACFPASTETDPSVLVDVRPMALEEEYRELRL